MMKKTKIKTTPKVNALRLFIAFGFASVLLLCLFFFAVGTGSLSVGPMEIIEGLFFKENTNVEIIYDVRFPRIFIAIFGGMALAVSGTLLQAVMKNPLTDPGIIGISSAAALVASIMTSLFPMLYFATPLFSMIGGVVAYILIYSLAWDGGANPTKLILVGVALNMTFLGIAQGIGAMGGSGMSTVQSIVSGNIVQKTWGDVHLLAFYGGVGLVLSLLTARSCDLLALDDKTARGLGVNVDRDRFLVALVAILLASITTAIVGVIGFLGLCVPHIARLIVGTNHKILIPFSALIGASLLLFSDTLGRSLFYPYEVPAAVIMAIMGGPFLIFLLKLGGKTYGN